MKTRKLLALVLALVMTVSVFAGCTKTEPTPEAPTTPEGTPEAPKFKIGLMTGTVAQGEEEYRAAERLVAKYGEDVIWHQTYPDNFTKEQETVIANLVSMAADPDVKAIVMCQAVQGACAAFEKIREQRPDILLIAGTPAEEPQMVAERSDMVLVMDELGMGDTVPVQAQKLGAKTFVHYSFPRHMSYPMLAARRNLMDAKCKELGLTFVDATAPDPTSDAGISGAQQFILEDVPRKIKEYGKDTNFFSTNCSMQEPLIKACLDAGGIDAQQCCPSPLHGYPSALGIQIPEDKAGDIPYITEQVKAKITEKGGSGRFSTWPIPMAMMYIEAGVEYGIGYAKGEITSRNDGAKILELCQAIAGDVTVASRTYDEKNDKGEQVVLPNYYMMMCDFITF